MQSGVAEAEPLLSGEGSESFVDLSDSELDLLLADRMGCRLGLLLQIEAGESQGLYFPSLIGIDFRRATGAPPPLSLEFFHALLDSRIRVYESFA